ncbi:MAG: hypothetical protein LUC22_07300 [Prevotella sp.]|nr:hypothetical protein [Prevotella sp.]
MNNSDNDLFPHTLYFTSAEWESIRQYAENCGETPEEYIRGEMRERMALPNTNKEMMNAPAFARDNRTARRRHANAETSFLTNEVARRVPRNRRIPEEYARYHGAKKHPYISVNTAVGEKMYAANAPYIHAWHYSLEGNSGTPALRITLMDNDYNLGRVSIYTKANKNRTTCYTTRFTSSEFVREVARLLQMPSERTNYIRIRTLVPIRGKLTLVLERDDMVLGKK